MLKITVLRSSYYNAVWYIKKHTNETDIDVGIIELFLAESDKCDLAHANQFIVFGILNLIV